MWWGYRYSAFRLKKPSNAPDQLACVGPKYSVVEATPYGNGVQKNVKFNIFIGQRGTVLLEKGNCVHHLERASKLGFVGGI